MRHIDEIAVHCAATRPEWWKDKPAQKKVNEIKRWHVLPKPDGNGWSDIGYHFVLDRDGTEVKGRPVSRAGAHILGHNANTIGVCLIGGHGAAATDSFEDHFTPEQDAALRRLIKDLKEKYPTIKKVSGHNEYANKGCPGFNVPEWYSSGVNMPTETKHSLWSLLLAIFGGRQNA